VIAIACTGALAACNGSSSSGSDDNGSVDTVISGSLVYPESLSLSTQSAMSETFSTKSSACSNIPEGYVALSDATVELEDSFGGIIGTSTTTDSCGDFTFNIEEELANTVEVVKANKDNFKTITSDVNNFIASSTLKVASTIPSDSSYEISGFTQSSDSELNLIVTDSSSHKAVINLAPSAFILELNGLEVENSTITSSTNLTDNASSIVISLDASGSMGLSVYDDNYNDVLDSDGNLQTRYTIAATAAHELVDITKANDPDAEFSVVLFSSDVYPLTDEIIASSLDLEDANGNEITFSTNAVNGFIDDSATLHTLIDIYNPHSEMYSYSYYSTTVVERNDQRVDNISNISYYPFSGITAFYDSLDVALDQFDDQTQNPRVIAVTDGADNASSNSYLDVIDKALAANIPISIVSAGSSFSSVDEDIMQKIAEDTGSEYLSVTDISQLAGFFTGLSTQATYNYSVDLYETLVPGDELTATVEINGETVSRDLTID